MAEWTKKRAEANQMQLVVLKNNINHAITTLISLKETFERECSTDNFKGWTRVKRRWRVSFPRLLVSTHKQYLEHLTLSKKYLIIDTGSGESNLYQNIGKKIEDSNKILAEFMTIKNFNIYKEKVKETINVFIKEMENTNSDIERKIRFLKSISRAKAA